MFWFVLICSALFCFVLLCSALFCFVLICSDSFCFLWFQDWRPGWAERHWDEADLDIVDCLLQFLYLCVSPHLPQRLWSGQSPFWSKCSGLQFSLDIISSNFYQAVGCLIWPFMQSLFRRKYFFFYFLAYFIDMSFIYCCRAQRLIFGAL